MSPAFSSPTLSITTKARPQHQELHALHFTISVWVLLRPLLTITSKMQETGPMVHSPYPRSPERLTICRYHYKSSTFCYSKTLCVGLVWGSNPRPPALQSGALPTELTTRCLCFLIVSDLINAIPLTTQCSSLSSCTISYSSLRFLPRVLA